MRVAFFEMTEWQQEKLAGMLAEHSCVFSASRIQEADLHEMADAEAICVFIYSHVDRTIIERFPHLKLIATSSTGFDHIDLAACRERGVTVCNVPTYGENTVAEHTFALVLSLSRNIHKSYVRVLQGNYSRDGLMGFDLKDRTLGVIGVGHIGQHVIKIARGFGMRVLACDVQQDHFLAELLGFEYVSLDVLLAGSDIVTLHMPYTAATHHFMNAERLGTMRRGALLINTSRGGLVDTAALIAALDDGKLGGAGLDVLEGEQYMEEEKDLLRTEQPPEVLRSLLRDHILLRRENVVFTPHNAFNSREALLRILRTTADNINSFARGQSINQVHQI
jgi:D-lactate dehydrogenase